MVTDINEITNLITQLYPDLPYPTFSVSSDEDSRILWNTGNPFIILHGVSAQWTEFFMVSGIRSEISTILNLIRTL